ncbi:MAG: MFS transporter [Acidobacteriota bacterium]
MSEPLKFRTKFFYGVGSTAESAITIAFNTFNFLFYNNVLGLPGTLAGLAVTIAVIFDAVSDPVIGSVSDRWRSRLGRRHPFLYVAPIPLGLCFFAIYSPPAFLDVRGLFIWFTSFTVGLRIALTFYQVPHLALGAELSDDYRERSVVMSYNAILGMVGGSATFFLSWTWLGAATGGAGNRDNFAPIGLVIGAVATIAVWMSAYFTRDQIPRLKKLKSDVPPFSLRQLASEVLLCFKNRNYVWLLLGMLGLAASNGIRDTVGAYVYLFFWELQPEQLRFFGLISPLAIVVAFVVTPRLHTRFDKRETMLGGIFVFVVATTLPLCLRLLGWFPANGEPALFPLIAVFLAVYQGAAAILAISVLSALADIADEHELDTGRRQEAFFYSARSFASKMTSGFGLFLGGIAIDLIGWPTGATQGDYVEPGVVFNLGVIDGPLSAVPAMLSIYFYGRYGIDKVRHAEIQRLLQAQGQ